MTAITTIVERFIEALHKKDVAAAVALFAHDGVYREAGASPLTGHAAIESCLGAFVALDRPWSFIIDDVVASGRDARAAVVYRFLIEGGNGEQLERAGCAIVTCLQGRFTEWREYSG